MANWSYLKSHNNFTIKYIRKTYLKTASLIANSCDAVAHLSQCSPQKRKAARDFGKYIGLAFQVQDDRLDFISDAAQLGKVKTFPIYFFIVRNILSI